ncbi:MAG: hypothetical protein U5K79_17560 [Cyclobacteriaceae bacterium]|nr:hypothetical protein [Cyclobacteriaceae bacterium]
MNAFLRMVVLLIFISGLYFILPKIKIDNSIVRWLPDSSATVDEYKKFLEKFNSDALLILAVESVDSAFYSKEISPGIEKVAQLEHVISIDTWPAKNIQYKKESVAGVSSFIIRFKPNSHLNPNRPELIAQIMGIFVDIDAKIHLAGTGVIYQAINEQTRIEMGKYLLLGIFLLICALVVLIRKPVAILQTLLVAIGGVASIFYVSALCDVPISLVHTLIPIITLFYSTSISLHILFHAGDFKKVIKPTFLVIMTTCIGFSVFLLDRTPILKDFAIIGLTGLISSFFWSLVIFYPKAYQYKVSNIIKMRFAGFPVLSRFITLPVAILVLAFSIPGILNLQAEINSLSVLSKDDRAVRDHIYIDEKVGHYFPLEYIVDESKYSRREVSKWVNTIYKMEQVGAVIPYYRLPNFINKKTAGYQSKSDDNLYRITFMVPLLYHTAGMELVNKMDVISDDYFAVFRPQLTGYMTLYANVADGLFSSLSSKSANIISADTFHHLFVFEKNETHTPDASGQFITNCCDAGNYGLVTDKARYGNDSNRVSDIKYCGG